LLGGGVSLNIRHPLRLNVGFLLHQNVGFSRIFDFDGIDARLGDDLALEALTGSIRITRTAQGLLAHAELRASTTLTCGRCLELFEQGLHTSFDELFVYPPERASEPMLAVPKTGLLDITSLLREYFILDIPIQPVCRTDCQGLCPECGNNRNLQACEHPQAPIDPRLAPLASLLRDA
jgi:uncharacterized protein